jgi:ABC-type Na+ efflux pump permease subunit
MKDFEPKWQQLVAAARRAPVDDDLAAPYGFATRVAARAFSQKPPFALLAVFGRFSVRALWMAGVLMLVSMAANYIAFASSEEDEQNLVDPVAEVLSAL